MSFADLIDATLAAQTAVHFKQGHMAGGLLQHLLLSPNLCPSASGAQLQLRLRGDRAEAPRGELEGRGDKRAESKALHVMRSDVR